MGEKTDSKVTVKKVKKKNPHEGHRKRLRDRFDFDPEMLSFAEHEVLEFHLSLVIPRKDTNEIAHALINKFGSLDSVLAATPAELSTIKNMTVCASYLLASEFAVARRAFQAGVIPESAKRLERPGDSEQIMSAYFFGRKVECFCMALLDVNFRQKRVFFYPGSTAAEVLVDCSELVLKATREGAKYVIIAHNHPGGNVSPSFEDIQFTNRLLEALEIMEIDLIDHVIFHDLEVFSFHNSGLLGRLAGYHADKLMHPICETPEERQQFLLELNEYLIDREKLVDESIMQIVTKPKSEIVEEYKKKMNLKKEPRHFDDDSR